MRKAIRYWSQDWNRFCRDVLGARLDNEQQEILHSVQVNPRTSVASGTARGKDFVAACAALSFFYLTPRWDNKGQLIENTKVALTAPTDRQVRNIMMPEISRLWNRAKARGIQLTGKLNAYDIRTENDEWFLAGFKADEHNHEAWSGFHAVNTMFVVTEASGISEDTFAAIEGNLQGNSRLLIVFNPNVTTGYAARAMKSDRFAKFRLNSLNAENVVKKQIVIPGQVDYEWVKDKVDNWCTRIYPQDASNENDDFQFEGQWYRPEDLFRIKVLGKFPKVAEDVLIPQQWIEEAVERWKLSGLSENDYRLNNAPDILGVDIAGMGRDSSCFIRRRGNCVVKITARNSGGKADHMRDAGDIMALRRQNPEMYVSIDTIGEGAAVFSRCIEQESDHFHIISCKYSEAAKTDSRELTDITGQYRFTNMRAYLFWCVRDWLNPKNGYKPMLPPDETFMQEATEIRWLFRSDGRIIIEPKDDIKKRLGRSPDKFDALANTFYPIEKQKNKIDLTKIAKAIRR